MNMKFVGVALTAAFFVILNTMVMLWLGHTHPFSLVSAGFCGGMGVSALLAARYTR